ncbi:PD-(D/E)XK nuclease family protein [Chitinophaga flava]|uniref:Nuclease n=1 Tax=Chitinophaga flava TaxID=2259036 RepID=A0A365Y3A3_9BACT|nr:PD-(D/E)XK nuclease family protein [Chitinophaga flava]RBL92761.1 nuclease [Chitinophaga flava]
MSIPRPNLFKISTKELSQDAIITWLLQWANPEVRSEDKALHECGTALLRLLISNYPGLSEKNIERVEAGRQWEKIDIWAEIYFHNGEKLLLIIEDKVFAGEHADQLTRYKEYAEQWCKENDFGLICAFIKIGSEAQSVLKKIEDKGYNVFTRNKILECLKDHLHTDNNILEDFVLYIQGIEAAHESFRELPLNKWYDQSWIGFYQYVESQIKNVHWHYVNNPSGGFWNLHLTWKYWIDIPVYMQIEQGRLCYKVALCDDETGLGLKPKDMNLVQDHIHRCLVDFALKNNFNEIVRPNRYTNRGSYRTIGVIYHNDWSGDPENILDKELVINNLKRYIDFHDSFIDYLRRFNYKGIGLNLEGDVS